MQSGGGREFKKNISYRNHGNIEVSRDNYTQSVFNVGFKKPAAFFVPVDLSYAPARLEPFFPGKLLKTSGKGSENFNQVLTWRINSTCLIDLEFFRSVSHFVRFTMVT